MDQDTYEKRKKARQESKIRSFERMKNRQLSSRAGYDLIDKSYNVREGVVKVNMHNKLEHEAAKFKLAYLLMKQGYKVYTEVIFINKKRADIYCPESMEVYEIVCSESEKSIEKKKSNYPEDVSMFFLKAEDVLKVGFCL